MSREIFTEASREEELINVHLPGIWNTGSNSKFGAIISAISKRFSTVTGNIQYLNDMLGIDGTVGDDLDARWGSLLGVTRRYGEVDSRYRGRLKASIIMLQGGTALALKYCVLIALNMDNYPSPDINTNIIDIVDGDPGYVTINIYISDGFGRIVDSEVIVYLNELIHNTKAFGVNPTVKWKLNDDITIGSMSAIDVDTIFLHDSSFVGMDEIMVGTLGTINDNTTYVPYDGDGMDSGYEEHISHITLAVIDMISSMSNESPHPESNINEDDELYITSNMQIVDNVTMVDGDNITIFSAYDDEFIMELHEDSFTHNDGDTVLNINEDGTTATPFEHGMNTTYDDQITHETDIVIDDPSAMANVSDNTDILSSPSVEEDGIITFSSYDSDDITSLYEDSFRYSDDDVINEMDINVGGTAIPFDEGLTIEDTLLSDSISIAEQSDDMSFENEPPVSVSFLNEADEVYTNNDQIIDTIR
jgi:hypothetical protein